jgi:uncharacterized RDD family membrane protein YckC
MNPEDSWYTKAEGAILGPFSLAELQQLVSSGQVGKLHQVMRGNEPWRNAGTVAALFPQRPATPVNRRPIRQPQTEPSLIDLENDVEVEKLADKRPPRPQKPSSEAVACWFYSVEGNTCGPVTTEHLKQRVAQGTAHITDPIWRDTMTTWAPMSEVPEFRNWIASLPQTERSTAKENYAGIVQRFLASIIDSAIVSAVSLIVIVIPVVSVIVSNNSESTESTSLLVSLCSFIITWIYFAGFESSPRHATPGKMTLGLQVLTENGQPISFGRATGRHFAKILSGLLLGIGYLLPLVSKKRQALHDSLAGCVVVIAGK